MKFKPSWLKWKFFSVYFHASTVICKRHACLRYVPYLLYFWGGGDPWLVVYRIPVPDKPAVGWFWSGGRSLFEQRSLIFTIFWLFTLKFTFYFLINGRLICQSEIDRLLSEDSELLPLFDENFKDSNAPLFKSGFNSKKFFS